jgi:hypothetical protein
MRNGFEKKRNDLFIRQASVYCLPKWPPFVLARHKMDGAITSVPRNDRRASFGRRFIYANVTENVVVKSICMAYAACLRMLPDQ